MLRSTLERRYTRLESLAVPTCEEGVDVSNTQTHPPTSSSGSTPPAAARGALGSCSAGGGQFEFSTQTLPTASASNATQSGVGVVLRAVASNEVAPSRCISECDPLFQRGHSDSLISPLMPMQIDLVAHPPLRLRAVDERNNGLYMIIVH